MFEINTCGHNSHHSKPCDIEHSNGLSDYLILFIKKESWFIHNNQKHVIPSNSILCFPPDTYIHYGCDEPGYNDDWIHFQFNEKELEFFQALKIPFHQLIRPYDFHKISEYVRIMSNTFFGASLRKKEILDHLLQILLLTLQEELVRTSEYPTLQKYYRDFSILRTNIYNNPSYNWRIPDLSNKLSLSLSYFQHLYKGFFNCSCQNDIITARLDLAKYYLTYSEMSITGISDFCGYENDSHFMRQFKKFTGTTPSVYRQNTRT
ncbi:MAG: AraC family transcriptional regulator [Lachnospiraceae bacterium]